MIHLDDCKFGYLYKIKSRNFDYGVFTGAKRAGFVGIRQKFGSFYLFEEYHYDTGAPYGTVTPLRELELCPVENIYIHDLGSECSKCGVDCAYKYWETPEEKQESVYPGRWVHLAPTECTEVYPVGKDNKELYQWLKERIVYWEEVSENECANN